LNLPQGKHHNFKLFWPIVGGKLNETDYPTPRVVVSDMETIWTKVIHEDLGIEPKQFRVCMLRIAELSLFGSPVWLGF
jgi:hypothetical protein